MRRSTTISRQRDSERNRRARRRIVEIRRRISQLDHVCSGTLLRRTKVCGKAVCRCARDPSARHGPYYEWSRREGGRLVHTVLSPAEAKAFRRAIRNYREALQLLRRWERETARLLRSKERRNH